MPKGKKMKILITTEFYYPFQCGVTTAVVNEIKALEQRGHEIRVLTIGEGRKSFWDEERKCWYIRSNFPKLYKDSYASLAINDPILKSVEEWKPEIIHSQSEFFSFLFASTISRRLSIPIVHTCHTDFVAYSIHFTSFTRVWCFFASLVVPFLIRKAKRLICSTDKIYSLIQSYRINKPIDRIMVGLDLDLFRQPFSIEERRSFRKQFGLSEDDVVFLSVSRLSQEKRVDETIRLFSHILSSCHKAKLMVVGDGSLRGSLEKIVKDEGIEDDVIFTGEVASDEVWKYYRSGDIYIGSSLSETQCLSYVEAMASGMPLLVKDDAVLKGYLLNNRNGMTFNSFDDFVLKAGILASSAELRKKLGEEAKKSVGRFSLPIFGEKLRKSFESARKG